MTAHKVPTGRRLFGTDGVRGTANEAPMDAATSLRLGQAAGSLFARGGHRHRVVIGKDTRLSGYMIEPALAAGFVGAGIDVVLVGPLPTPAIAMLTRSLRADVGVMISASHNAYQDNGIKFFGPDGLKLTDAQEDEIEALVSGERPLTLAEPSRLGRASRLEDAPGRYIEFAKATFPRGLRLDGLRVVLDCAHGGAYKVAPTVLWELGADVVPIGVSPDGTNINRSVGSTSPQAMVEMVRERRADVGIALDGDADRLVVADERGNLVDGDQVLAVIAGSWRDQGRLSGGSVVATVMSNMGLERHLRGLGVGLHRTRVGDRHVGERMRETGCNVGGEQSGHVILSDFGTTGDGLVAALQMLAVMVSGGRRASECLRRFEPMPQSLVNVRVAWSGDPAADPAVAEVVRAASAALGEDGRVLVRASGTESLVRVMAEGGDEGSVRSAAEQVAAVVEARAAQLASAPA